jgi:hypothetical protein
VVWAAWAEWTIKLALNRNEKGPGFSRAFFLCRSHAQVTALERIEWFHHRRHRYASGVGQARRASLDQHRQFAGHPFSQDRGVWDGCQAFARNG